MKQKKRISLFILALMLLAGIGAMAQRPLRGVVKDQDGITLPGANILVRGTTIGVTTNLDGSFSLELPAGQNLIEISYIGYKPRSINVEGRDFVEIVLELAAE